MDGCHFESNQVSNQAELIRTPPASLFTSENKIFDLWRGRKVGVVGNALVVSEASDRGPINVGCAGMRRAIGMESATHAHVTDNREASAERKAPEFYVGFAFVGRVSFQEKLPDERLRSVANRGFEP